MDDLLCRSPDQGELVTLTQFRWKAVDAKRNVFTVYSEPRLDLEIRAMQPVSKDSVDDVNHVSSLAKYVFGSTGKTVLPVRNYELSHVPPSLSKKVELVGGKLPEGRRFVVELSEHFFKKVPLRKFVALNNLSQTQVKRLFFDVFSTMNEYKRRFPRFNHNALTLDNVYVYETRGQGRDVVDIDGTRFSLPQAGGDVKIAGFHNASFRGPLGVKKDLYTLYKDCSSDEKLTSVRRFLKGHLEASGYGELLKAPFFSEFRKTQGGGKKRNDPELSVSSASPSDAVRATKGRSSVKSFLGGPQLNGMPHGVMPQMNGVMPQVNGVVPQLNGVVPQLNGMMPQLNGTVPPVNSVPQLNGIVPQMNSMVPHMNGGPLQTPGYFTPPPEPYLSQHLPHQHAFHPLPGQQNDLSSLPAQAATSQPPTPPQYFSQPPAPPPYAQYSSRSSATTADSTEVSRASSSSSRLSVMSAGVQRSSVDEGSADPVSADPVSADPVSADPVSADPVSADPVSADPVSADELSTGSAPAQAAPAGESKEDQSGGRWRDQSGGRWRGRKDGWRGKKDFFF